MALEHRPYLCCLAIVKCLVLIGGLCCAATQTSADVLSQARQTTIGVKYPYVCPHEVTVTKLLINQTESGYVQYAEYGTKLPTLNGFTMHYWFNLADASTTSTMFNYGLNAGSQNNNLTVQLRVMRDRKQYFMVQVNDEVVSLVAVNPPVGTGYWHHALHSWSPDTLQFSHYLDGKLINTHRIYWKDRMVVPGGGVAVSGQHQNTSLTMGMDQGEGLNGWFTLFQLSSKSLEPFTSTTEAAVARLFLQCTGEMEGDLISWRKTPRKGYGGIMETPSYSKVCGKF